ncbi:MAG: cytochrome c biogenesis protein CcdA [Hungatella sp.]
MGFSVEVGIPAFTVFLQGILSFFSPCVLPLVPLYIGYLTGGAKSTADDGTIQYKKKTVMLNTLFFVIGVSFAFFLLGFGFTAVGRFFGGHRILFARIGGLIVIFFGLFQLGIFGSDFFKREHRLPLRLNRVAMNPLLALVMGFTFSFAWTPCVGPALTSVLLMASSANSSAMGFVLIGVYTLGFVLPFLAIGIFTGTVLEFIKNHQQVVRYTVKLGGVLMILMGVMMFTGWMNGITGYLSQTGNKRTNIEETQITATDRIPAVETNQAEETDPSTAQDQVIAPDFTLLDQNGEEHTLSDYQGKVVFLNFWATWCPPCRAEMPDIQKLYEEYGGNAEDLVILGVANPKTTEHPSNQDGTVEEVGQFLKDGAYTYPVVMDITGSVLSDYYVSSFPTTFMIDREGMVFGYVTGTLSEEIMRDIIQQTMSGKRNPS